MTEMSYRVVVVGAGAWGTTLALVAHRAGRDVLLLSSHEATISTIRDRRRHPRSLDGIDIPDVIAIDQVDRLTLSSGDIVLVAMPVQNLAPGLRGIRQLAGASAVVSVAKGIETTTLRRPSEVLLDHVRPGALAVLSGPNIASEIASGQPATAVVASESVGVSRAVQRALSSSTFRVYTSDDVIGVELGGALKNIVAIGAGIADALGAGHNAKAAFMTRGIGEIARLGIALGANPLTFAGLSGTGDLIATCSSTASRNHQVGRRLATGESLPSIQASMVETAEGIHTTRAAWLLARRHGVETPIIDGMYRILFEDASPLVEAAMLMDRDPTQERS